MENLLIMLLRLVWLFAAINAFTIGSSLNVCPPATETTALTTAGFTLPLTTLPNCPKSAHIFTVPKGYFAFVELHAYELQRFDTVSIFNIHKSEINAMNDFNLIGFNNFSNTMSWPSDFELDVIGSSKNPQIRVSLNISVFPQTPMANIVKSYVTFPGASTVFLYANEWNDGESYKFTSKSGKVYVNAAVANEDGYVQDYLNNIFVYEGGVFVKTLGDLPILSKDERPYISSSNEIVLYCSKKINFTGTVMVTDYSNVQDLVKLTMRYIPNTVHSLSYRMDASEGKSAVTFVSSRVSPTNVTLKRITHEDAYPTGVLSYIAGGPIQNHSNAMNLTNDQLPKTFTGYANTFYLTYGVYDFYVTM